MVNQLASLLVNGPSGNCMGRLVILTQEHSSSYNSSSAYIQESLLFSALTTLSLIFVALLALFTLVDTDFLNQLVADVPQ